MNPKMTSTEQSLWKRWTQKQSEAVLNELITHYMYLVDYHVERITSHLPNSVSKDDVRSFGLYGLYDAIQKFEAERNLKFDTYASFRVKGTIIDGLRKEDWLSRSLRDKAKKVERISEELEIKLERKATSEEIGAELNMTAGEVESVVKDALFSNILSIEEKPKNGEEFNEGIGYNIPDETAASPEAVLDQEELEFELIESIKKLTKNEQLVVSLFYKEELTLTEIGEVLNLTTSRISQIHKKAIFKLKNILSKVAT
jgi:RNA polymerase sigma factor for flagellar operon FliA